jgi:S-adenosylmethionine:tRNA ribosyltransferase-isomerase
MNQPVVARGGYDFPFPTDRIAQQPAEVRGKSRSDARLLVYDRTKRMVEHRVFDELPEYLNPGDAVVVNNAAVVPSVLLGTDEHGYSFAVNVFSPMTDGTWHCLVLPASIARPGVQLRFGADREVTGELLWEEAIGVWRIALTPGGIDALRIAGAIAYPDYLDKGVYDPEHYQTCFASRPGATLFPSAARHFTLEMVRDMRVQGIAVVEVTNYIAARWQHGYLRDWLGEDVTWSESEDVTMPTGAGSTGLPFPRPERYEVSLEAADTINARRRAGGRVVICGTSALRTLETVSDERTGRVWPGTGWTNLVVGPGHRFKFGSSFLTNFHMPQSSELRLTAAFTGRAELLRLYREEVLTNDYLFNEFGDSMLIL